VLHFANHAGYKGGSGKTALPDSSTSAVPITAEPLGQSLIGDTEAILEPENGLVSGDQPPTETEAALKLGDGLGTGDRMVMELEGHLESEAADLLEPIGEGLDSNLVMDPPRPEGLEEPQPKAQNPLPGRGEASTYREGALIASLRKGLLACPLEALLEILPEESSSMSRTESPGELAEALLHAQLQVSFMR